ncbi:MAG: CoA-binding protein [Euryarchaeota archaeon]|nr:CoA-binding protein [Euryarchaeota archaeon]
MTSDARLREILSAAKTIAVVGCSKNPEKEAYLIPKYLKDRGYRVIPVNPTADEILGEKCAKNLADLPGPVDIVSVFRPGEETPSIVKEAIGKAKVVWMQTGIESEEAWDIGRDNGVEVIMDTCIKTQHQRLLGPRA